jgi:RNA polymerase sigma-70 factor, ECF subfamily
LSGSGGHRFFDAFLLGDVDALQTLLAADVVLQGNGGGKGPQFGMGIVGVRNVARIHLPHASVPPDRRRRGAARGEWPDWRSFRDPNGNVVGVMALELLDGQIQAIRGVSNPEKLKHLGPLGDAWEVRREMNQARRHSGD